MMLYSTGIILSIACAIAWGVNSVLLRWMQSEPAWQTLGTSVGNLVISALVFPWHQICKIAPAAVTVSFMSGITWAIGMYLHICSIPLVGISRAVPICGGFQVVFNALFGWLAMGELPGSSLGKVSVIVGVFLIVMSMLFIGGSEWAFDKEELRRRGLFLPIMAALVFSLYVAPVRYFGIPGEIAALPQAVGMVTGSVGLMSFRNRQRTPLPLRKFSFSMICLPGLVWGTGNVLLLLALSSIGISVSLALTRLSVVISSCFGVFYFKETGTEHSYSVLLAGLMNILGSTLVSIANSL